jgi:UDP-N-acetylglucosamine 2-epimerase (non-hydrolysing)
MRPSPEIAVVIGTRPEAIKLAPVVRALEADGRVHPLVISTGQHREMLDQALDVFDLEPEIDLDLMRPSQSLAELTARTLERTRELLRDRRPALVVIQGDTTTAFAAALAAFYERIPVAHVEAGLRSGDPESPFPEEANRRMIDSMAALLFAPTVQAAACLEREGVRRSSIHVTGNTVVDALLWARERIRRDPVEIPGLPREACAGKKVILVTAHRRESFGAPIEAICRAIRRITHAVADAVVAYPVHLNPQVDGPVRCRLEGEPRIHLLPPLDYLQFIALLDRADLVLTDSGGVQEEAPTFGKPLLVLRDVTERAEGIAAGVARLVGTREERIVAEAVHLLTDEAAYAAMASGGNPYGDGRAAERIARIAAGAVRLATARRGGPAAVRGRLGRTPAARPIV